MYWKELGNKRPELRKYNLQRKGVFHHSRKTRNKISSSGRLVWNDEKRKRHSKILKKIWSNPKLRKRASIRNSGKGNYFYDKHFKLENHPNWRGGSSFAPYALGWNKTFKEQIRYRDGYKCQLCGVPESECSRKLHVHHVDYVKVNIKNHNLISLCNSCHMKTNFNREYYIDIFSEKQITE